MKFTIMIVSPKREKEGYTKKDIQELYRFLTLAGGNYRNAICIECSHGFGYMLVADQNARPVLFPIQKFYEMTGELPQRDEMIGKMSRQAFDSVFRGWMLWNTDTDSECGICKMYEVQMHDEA